MPARAGGGRRGDTFVVQEHHARRLHWDFRLERDGVLVSWAVPKGLPTHPDQNRLAVHTEDHPLEYGSFEGEIPTGEYGAGRVIIWDSGTYETEKWSDREVKVVLRGKRVSGRYVLFQTRGDDWMVHRMDPPDDPDFEPLPGELDPMRPVRRRALPEEAAAYGYEFAWPGLRALAYVEGGRVRLVAGGGDVTSTYPEVRGLGAAFGSRAVLLDGVIVALDEGGRPSEEALRRRRDAGGSRSAQRRNPVTYVAFDVLHLDGRPTADRSYAERRRLLDSLDLRGPYWQAAPWFEGDGDAVARAARDQGMPGVVAKRLDAPYRPARRSMSWIEVAT